MENKDLDSCVIISAGVWLVVHDSERVRMKKAPMLTSYRLFSSQTHMTFDTEEEADNYISDMGLIYNEY